jgi:UDP-glucose 4-epimerase
VEAEPIYASERPGELPRVALDPARAAMQLGWQPFTGFADGVASTVDYFRALRAEG